MRTLQNVLVSLILLGSAAAWAGPVLHDGDLVFQVSNSSQSLAIQLATGSKYSHMGMILHRKGKPLVLEAGGPVRFTPFEEWVERGQDGLYVVKRLKEADRALTPAVLRKMNDLALDFMGVPYDWVFEWSDNRMYCSELVWKIYYRAAGLRIGKPQKMKEFNLDPPEVRKLLQERYGDKIPLEEPVISPGRMFESDLLETVEIP